MRDICNKCDNLLFVVTKEQIEGEDVIVVDICEHCRRELKDKIEYWYYVAQTRKEYNK